MRAKPKYLFLLFCALLASFLTLAQTQEQKELEAQRKRLQKEIAEMNRLLSAERKEKGSVLDQMEVLDTRINKRQQLIRLTNRESNLLNRQIHANVRQVGKLKNDLKLLREDYAAMIQKSYQNRSQQNRVMFLLSAENFLQAYKRLQYLKQYASYRKEQGEQIVVKTEVLNKKNQELAEQRKTKEALLAANRKERQALMAEKETQNSLLASIKKNESKYAASLKKKQQEARRIDREIDKLIRAAIAASNKKSGKKGSSTKFALTPEAKLVADNFSANKGRHIWPVERGIISKGFGVYKDAVYPGIKHQNNGVIIATDAGTPARSIFKGEVIAILSVPGGNLGVQVKHGNYITTYYNLSKLYVKKGDKVAAKEALGEIYTNRNTQQTRLKFYLYQDSKKLNPQQWIHPL